MHEGRIVARGTTTQGPRTEETESPMGMVSLCWSDILPRMAQTWQRDCSLPQALSAADQGAVMGEGASNQEHSSEKTRGSDWHGVIREARLRCRSPAHAA